MSAPVFEALRKLEHLSIEGCQSSAFHIPDTIRDCVALTHLHIRDCPVLDVLPVGIRNLASLVEFNITKCNNLRCLPAGFGSGKARLGNSSVRIAWLILWLLYHNVVYCVCCSLRSRHVLSGKHCLNPPGN